MAASEREHRKEQTPSFREMTPAHVRESAGAEFAEVMFLESARIYKLFKNNPKYEEIRKRLREAIAKKRFVGILLDQPHGGVIQDIEAVR